jgi:hypothetical protein
VYHTRKQRSKKENALGTLVDKKAAVSKSPSASSGKRKKRK